MTEKPIGPTVYRLRGGWISGGMVDTPPLRATYDSEQNTIDVGDASGLLLSLTPREAADLATEIRSILGALR